MTEIELLKDEIEALKERVVALETELALMKMKPDFEEEPIHDWG